MIDMSQNRVPYGLLTDEEKAALHEYEKAGGEFTVLCADGEWRKVELAYSLGSIYRTVPLPLTQDEIAWDRLPVWVEWVARDVDETIFVHEIEPEELSHIWSSPGDKRRIDDFPGIVQIGTVDWTESKQRRPKK